MINVNVPAVSVLTASCRALGLALVGDCLSRQTVRDFEWIICLPANQAKLLKIDDQRVTIIEDPPRRDGDFYRLNGAWNRLVAAAKADLLVFAVDWIWFEPNMLENYLAVHKDNSNACVSSVAEHCRKVINGRPEILWNTDIRLDALAPNEADEYVLPPEWMELSFASIPRAKLIEVGGFDEDYDRVRGMSEKECALRLAAAGCQFFLGQSHRVFTHPKEQPEESWQQQYQEALAMYEKHEAQIRAGTRKAIPPSANLTGAAA